MAFLQTQQLQYADGTNVNILVTNNSQIQYLESVEGYTENWKQDAIESTRVCWCRWNDRFQLIRDFLGTSTFQSGNSVGGVTSNLTRQIPEQHPEYNWMYAMECQLLGGFGVPTMDTSDLAKAVSSSVDWTQTTMANPDTYMIQYALAKVSVTYRPVDYYILADTDVDSSGMPPQGELGRYISWTYTYAAENLSIPGNAYQFVNPDPARPASPIAENPPITVQTLEVTALWHQIPNIPFANIGPLIGKVNNATFANFFRPGTLLFMTPDIRRYRTAAGDFVYDIGMKFLYRTQQGQTADGSPGGHNYLFRKGPIAAPINQFTEVSTDGRPHAEPADPNVHIYNSGDFSQLFILPAAA